MRKGQRGMTFIGLLCVLAVCGLIAYAIIRLVPVYLNYMKVARIMEQTASETKGGDVADPGTIRRTLERRWSIDDPTGIDFKDVEITKEEGGVQLHAAYDDVVPYLANVSLSVHFDKTVTVK